ncbi:MAG: hypothetical protein BKP49_03900 [Treponema sp. CETP13]|nr:MAG: hypothetical protein BKP49_03900 [Treponema sp. CETP13]
MLDLSNYSFTTPLLLRGKWLFTPDDTLSTTTLEVPGSWKCITETPYSSGTYTVTIKMPDTASEMLALQLPELDQFISVTINNKLVFRPRNQNKNIQKSTIKIIPFKALKTNTITIHLRNEYFRQGGLIYPPQIGTYDTILQEHYALVLFKSTMIGFLFFILLFFIFLFLTKYPDDKAFF